MMVLESRRALCGVQDEVSGGMRARLVTAVGPGTRCVAGRVLGWGLGGLEVWWYRLWGCSSLCAVGGGSGLVAVSCDAVGHDGQADLIDQVACGGGGPRERRRCLALSD